MVPEKKQQKQEEYKYKYGKQAVIEEIMVGNLQD